MSVDENEFFRQVTRLICGSLDIEKALSSCRKEKVKQLSDQDNKLQKLDEVLCSHIQRALNLAKGKITGSGGAAEILGINPSTLRGKMDKLGIPYKQQRKTIGEIKTVRFSTN